MSSSTRFSVDFCQSPLRVGGLLLGKYIVSRGSKGIKLTVAGAPAKKDEVVACLEDARSTAKNFFGTPSFDAAVVVVPNTTSEGHIGDIISYGRGRGFNITQVIHEHTAVSAAYVETVKPTSFAKLAIISFTGSLLEVSVVVVDPIDVGSRKYEFKLIVHSAHREAIDWEDLKHHDQASSGGLIGFVGGAVKSLVVDPFEKAFELLKHILEGLDVKGGSKVEKVVFVGKASKSEKFRGAVMEKFPDAVVWDEIEPDKVAAYGAATASYLDWKVSMHQLQAGEPESLSSHNPEAGFAA